MAEIKIKKGLNLNLEGAIADTTVTDAKCTTFAVIPDDFTGIVPRLDAKEGASVAAGDVLYHDKTHPEVKVTSPVAGRVAAVVKEFTAAVTH